MGIACVLAASGVALYQRPYREGCGLSDRRNVIVVWKSNVTNDCLSLNYIPFLGSLTLFPGPLSLSLFSGEYYKRREEEKKYINKLWIKRSLFRRPSWRSKPSATMTWPRR